MTNKKATIIPIALFSCFALLLSSCSPEDAEKQTSTSDTKTTETTADSQAKNSQSNKAQGVEERAAARWQALIDEEWKEAYAFETPGYKKAYTHKQYRKKFGILTAWKSFKHIKTEYNEDKTIATVKMEITMLFQPEGGGEMLIPNVIPERWLLKDKQWWHISESTSLSGQ